MIQNKSPYKDYGDSDLTDDYLFLEEEFEKGKEPSFIPNELYDKYNVKKGLRNNNGTGVLVLLTKISEVHGYNIDNDGNKIDDQGHLYYRGYDIYDLAKLNKEAYGYERVMFLILFCHLPSEEELEKFHAFISDSYSLPYEFAENFILKTPSRSTMNTIQRAILSLYSYDDNPDSIDTFETLKKGLSIIAKMPAIISYSYQAKKHYIDGKSLFIHKPKKEYTMAQNILYMTRSDGKFTTLEAETLDLALIIHADHGGGNNSTFANIVISSTGTDIYSSMSGSLGSLKGPRHGGANKEVRNMMKQVIHSIGLKASEEDIRRVINNILDKKFYDRKGLIYGIGHAVYTLSDPRAILLKEKCHELAIMKGYEAKFNFYATFERIAIEELTKRKGPGFVCCTNVDFYSGLTYEILNISSDLYTPLFACSRMIGWLAHNIENKQYCDKIVRPAGKYVGEIIKEEE